MTDYADAIRTHFAVPDHIAAIASACAYDLMNGPSWLLVPQGDVTRVNDDCVASYREDLEDEAEPGDVIEQTYCGAAAQVLRDWLADLPSEVWVDCDCDGVSEREPEQYWDTGEVDEDGETIYAEEDLSNWCHVEYREIVRALFGTTIAREFK